MTLLDFLRTYFNLIFYIGFLFVFVIFSLAAFYHCLEYGYAGDATKFMMFVYSAVSLFIIVGTFFLLFTI